MNTLDAEVTAFLNELQHPLRDEIDALRQVILSATPGLQENIKWNGPNYTFNGEDRITMRVQPPGKKIIQLIFHRGAAKQQPAQSRLIHTGHQMLEWKENDRAVATFRNMSDIEANQAALSEVVQQWIAATM